MELPDKMAVGTRRLRHNRARTACQRCHARKTRCDAGERMPCTYCASIALDCILIDSQRGRYCRARRDNANSNDREKRSGLQQNHHDKQATAQHGNAVTTQASPKSPSDRALPATAGERPTLWRSNTDHSQYIWSATSEIGPSPSLENYDSPEMLYAQVAERSVTANEEPIRYAGESIFLGEAFSLTYVIHDVLAPLLLSDALNFQKRLHFPISESRPQLAQPLMRENVVTEQIELLRKKDLLYQPPTEVLQKLLDVYFDSFHPAYPVIERARFASDAHASQRSELVLNAMLMVAVSICDLETVRAMRFSNRHEARSVFYRQARALYDEDAEPDKIDCISAVFLMSFWWGGPNEQKDSWHWLGICIGQAQSLGLHRTTETSNIDPDKSRLWKVIWWSLRVRDVLVSGSIGRPQHVSNSDCDVELPEPDDVPQHSGISATEESVYFCQIAKLCCIMSHVISSRYSATNAAASQHNRKTLEAAMQRFHQEIPPVLRYQGIDSETRSGLWASMLTMAYDYAIILLCRPAHSKGDQNATTEWGDGAKALKAAMEVTRVIEDVLSASMIRLCQIHTIPALFNALAIHMYSLCTSNHTTRQLAEARANFCMLGLASIEESWPVGGWVLRLFIRIMGKLRQSPQAGFVSTKGRRLSRQINEQTSETVITHPTDARAATRNDEATRSCEAEMNGPGGSCAQDSTQSFPVNGHGAGFTDQFGVNSFGGPLSCTGYGSTTNMFVPIVNLDFDTMDQDNLFQWLDLPHALDSNWEPRAS